MTARPYFWMIAASVCFATMGAISRWLGATSDWRMLGFVRALVMAALAVAFGLATRAPLTLRGTPILWIRSIVGSLGMLCTFYTLTHLQFSEATTLLKSYPLAVTILAWVVLRERPGWTIWAAVAVGITGVVVIARPHFDQSRLAILIGILSSFMTAIVMLGLNRLGSTDARTIVAHFSLVATVTCGMATMIGGSAAMSLAPFHTSMSLALLVAMGVVGTIGQMAMTRAFALGEPSRVSVVGLMELLFALGYDRVLWQRSFSLSTLAGMALVAAPTAWILIGAGPGASPKSAAPRESAAPPISP